MPIPNTLSRLNWKSAGPLHSPIRLSPWLQGTELSWPPSFPTLIIFKPSKPGAQTPTPPLSHLVNVPFASVMQSFENYRGCILLVRPFLHSIALKYTYIIYIIYLFILIHFNYFHFSQKENKNKKDFCWGECKE